MAVVPRRIISSLGLVNVYSVLFSYHYIIGQTCYEATTALIRENGVSK